jgi:polyisoprenoid-binding protein YceI
MAPRARIAARLAAAALFAGAFGPTPGAGAVLEPPAAARSIAVESIAAESIAAVTQDADDHAIDGRRSSAEFVVTVRLRGASAGHIAGVAGALQGNADKGWRVQVRLDAKGLRFDGPRWMERTTRSSTFLAVDRYPSIRFESDAFGDDVLRKGGPLNGQLTLRGLRRPVSFALLPSDCARPGLDCDIRVQGSVSRREFGMSAYRGIVADRVELRIRVRLRATGPAA